MTLACTQVNDKQIFVAGGTQACILSVEESLSLKVDKRFPITAESCDGDEDSFSLGAAEWHTFNVAKNSNSQVCVVVAAFIDQS